jgi:hypothetical protein
MPSSAAHTAHRWRKLEEPRATCDSDSATAVAHGRPGAGQRRCSHASGALLQAASGSHSRLQPRSDRSDYHVSARTCHRRRRSRRKPAAASGTRPSRMHVTMNMPLAASPAVANRPAEATRCLESRASTRTRVYHPQPIPDQRQLEVGWARLARAMRLAPAMSGDHLATRSVFFSREHEKLDRELDKHRLPRAR